MHDTTAQALSLAAAHHGVLSRHQLRDQGWHFEKVQRLVRSGVFEAIGPNALRAAGSANTPRRCAAEAVADAGPSAMLSHTSAAWAWGLAGFRLDPLHVIGDRGNQHRTSDYLATVHEPRLLQPSHITFLDGMRVTSPARTIFDLANLGLHPGRIERALDTAWAMNLVNQVRLDRMLADLARRGRRGITVMRQLLADRRDNYRPPESGLEHRFQQIVDRAGLPALRRQVDVGDGDQWVGRIDFVADDVPLLCRVQSARYHSALADRREDERRNALLRQDGWVVLEFTDIDIWHRKQFVVAAVREGRDDARRPCASRSGRVS